MKEDIKTIAHVAKEIKELLQYPRRSRDNTVRPSNTQKKSSYFTQTKDSSTKHGREI